MKHKFTIENAQYLADNCRSVIQRCLKVNRDLCEKCSQLNKSSQFFIKNNPIDLAQQGNVRLLLPPDQLSDFFEDNDNTIYVKQRTEIWKRIRDLCAVTGSTLHKGLGFGTLVQQKDHYELKFCGKEEPAHDENVQKMLDYGTNNEVYTY